MNTPGKEKERKTNWKSHQDKRRHKVESNGNFRIERTITVLKQWAQHYDGGDRGKKAVT